MRINQNHVFDVTLFTYNKEDQTFVSFISDLIGKGDIFELAKPMYDDAADLGFGIRNPKSGKVVYFVYEDNSGEDMAVYKFTSIGFKIELKCTIFGT